MIYPEWEEKLKLLSYQELGELFKVIFDFYRFLETQENPQEPSGFVHDLFKNRIIQISFESIKETIVKDYISYTNKVIANRDNGRKGGRPKLEEKKPTETHSVIFGKKPILLYNINYYIFIKEFININNNNIIYLINKAGEEKFYLEQYQEIDKLVKDGFDIETIKTVLNFIKQHEFWSKQILTVKKLRKKNKEGIPYIVVMLSEIQNFKPKKEIPIF